MRSRFAKSNGVDVVRTRPDLGLAGASSATCLTETMLVPKTKAFLSGLARNAFTYHYHCIR